MADHDHPLYESQSSTPNPLSGGQDMRQQRIQIKRDLFRMRQREVQLMVDLRAYWTKKRRDERLLRTRPHPSRSDPCVSYRTVIAKTTSRIVRKAGAELKSSKRTTVRVGWLRVVRRHRSNWVPLELVHIMIEHLLQTDTNALLAVMRTCRTGYQIGWGILYKDCTIRTGGLSRSVFFPFDIPQMAARVRSLTYTNTDRNVKESEYDEYLPDLEVLDTTEQLLTNSSNISQLRNLQYLSLTLWRRRGYHFDIFSVLPQSLKGLDVYLPDTEYHSRNQASRNLSYDFFDALPTLLTQLEHLRFRAEVIEYTELRSQALPNLKTLVLSTLRHHCSSSPDTWDNHMFAEYLRDLYEKNHFPNIVEMKVISQQVGASVELAPLGLTYRGLKWSSFIVRDIICNTTTGNPCLVGGRNTIWVRTTRESPFMGLADQSVVNTSEELVDLFIDHPSAQELVFQSLEGRGTWTRTARPRCSRFPISFQETEKSDHVWFDEQQWHKRPDVIPHSISILRALYLHEYVLHTRVIVPYSSDGMTSVPITQGNVWTGVLTPDLIAHVEAALPRFQLENHDLSVDEPEYEDELGFSTYDQSDLWEEADWLPGENSEEVESVLTVSECSMSDESSFSGTDSEWRRRYTTAREESADFNLEWASDPDPVQNSGLGSESESSSG